MHKSKQAHAFSTKTQLSSTVQPQTEIPQHPSLAQMISSVEKPSVTAHAAMLNRAMASKSSHSRNLLLQLQRQYGNSYVQRVVNLSRIQAKLTVGEPGDKYEQEAELMASRIMSMPDTAVQRQMTPEEELQTKPLADAISPLVQREMPEEEEQIQPSLQRATDGSLQAVGDIESRLNSSKGGGTPLPDDVRHFMEPRFGVDFSQVRVHTDSEAVQMNQELGAQAFTHGSDVYFGAGKVPSKDELTAHELTHVVQQSGANGIQAGEKTGRSSISGDIHFVKRQLDVTQRAPEPIADAQESGSDASSATEPWVMGIMGDTTLSLKIKLRAFVMNFLWGSEMKSEEEFINDLIDPNNPDNAQPSTGLSSDDAAKQLSELYIRNRAVDKAKSLMGADWHAPVDSDARNKADSLHRGNPQDAREQAMKVGMVWAFDRQDAIRRVKETALQKYQATKSQQAKATLEAATEVLTAIEASLNKPLESMNYSPGYAETGYGEFAEQAWRYLGSEKTKKHLEKLGAPLPWFTTCVTIVAPIAEAAGVDMKKWGALDMFHKRTQERFKASEAWVPADKKEQPKPGDILIFVSYLKDTKGVMQKELSKAVFQHVAVLVEPVAKNEDGTEKWVTADGGKGSSHKGEDKTGYTTRRYNPATQQFIPESHTNLQEAAEGGRYLLGFWSLPRLPMRTTDAKK
jgi:hypothetical protein